MKGFRPGMSRRSHLLLPHQVAKYLTPMHMALELLPLGLFNRDHATHLARMVNLVSMDTAENNEDMNAIALELGAILRKMFERAEAKGSWNTTADERKQLMRCTTIIDRFFRTWTSKRLEDNAARVDKINAYRLAQGEKFMDFSKVTEDMYKKACS